MSTVLHCPCGYHWRPIAAEPAAVDGPVHCPQCGAVVDTLPSRGSGLNSSDSETMDSSWPYSPSPGTGRLPSLAGYEIQGELGRGGMGVVYRAFSSKLNRTVALKTLKRIDPVALQRFKQEFRAVAGLNHPGLVTLYELISDGETWFFSMELVAGVGFLRYVRSGRSDDEPDADSPQPGVSLSPLQLIRLRRGLTQLVAAVASLHRAGLLHRDIKPSNVMVTAEERLVLLDFGLAAELGGDDAYLSIDANLVGTVGYMSPEQASIQRVTQASDCYSIGVVLYEALTGRVPFSGSALDVLLAKREEDPPPPRELVAEVPEDLNQLCVDLLQRNPEDRPTVEAILQRLTAAGSETCRNTVAAAASIEKTPLVGRDEHLATLQTCYREMEQGQPVLVLVHGNSGMGRSALLQEFCDRVRRQGSAVILSGRCYEQESVPFKALDSLIDSLCNYLRRLPHGEAVGLMPRDIQALMRVFPVLGRVEAVYDAPRRSLEGLDQQELRRRAVSALRELLGRIGDRRPLVLAIDDLQWGDVDSAVILCELLKPPDAPLLMLVGAYRAEDAQTSPFLQAFRETERRGLQRLNLRDVEVGPLSADEARRLAVLLLEAEGDSVEQAAMVAQESGGSPFFTKELTRYFRASQGQTPGRVDLKTILASRLCDLPAQDLRLLQILAAAGRPMDERELLGAAALAAEASSSLSRLKAEHLIRVTAGDRGIRVETYHDRIREAVRAQMEPDTLRSVHRCLADVIQAALEASGDQLTQLLDAGATQDKPWGERAISQEDWQRIFDLGFHYGAAGEHDRARFFALLAAEQAHRQHSLEIAERQYRIAEPGMATADARQRFRLGVGLGEVLLLRGRYEEASRQFQMAVPLADGNLARARIEGKLGELAFKQGDMRTASDLLEKAIGLLGRSLPRSNVGFLCMLIQGIAVQTIHSLWPSRFVGRKRIEGHEDQLLAAYLLGRLGHVYWFVRGKMATLATHLRSMNLAEMFPPTRELAQTYSEHAPGMSLVPWFSRAIRYAERSLAMREGLGDLWGKAQTLHFHGIVLYAASQYTECVGKCREAIRLFDQTGDFWELNMARYQVAASLYRLGDLGGAREEALKMHQSGLDLGDAQASGLAVDILSKASCGNVLPEVIRKELDRPRGADAQTASQVLQAEGVRRLAAGDFRAAADAFSRGWEIARRVGVTNTYVIPCLPWLATSLRREAERLYDSDPAESRRLLWQARRAACRGRRSARKFQNDLPHCLRELGLISVAAGRHRQARRFLDQSLSVAAQQGARYEHAQTSLATAELDVRENTPGAEERLVQAQAALRNINEYH